MSVSKGSALSGSMGSLKRIEVRAVEATSALG
jgi:hypothetical protein